ncbi:MAG: tetratricopeptide repeat protein [Acidobacteria bacterium]|nr:tetratricopeptide repeat protein [Acidobacteriota bacterium]MBI3657510.1 tetratricopeptide repeat protein [Acidobacteriota bacterium]
MRLGIKRAIIVLLGIGLVFGLSGCGLIAKLKARDHLNKGVRFYSEKKYDEAVESFKESIKLDPSLTNSYLYLGMTYAALSTGRQDNANAAIKTYQEVVERAGERTDLKVIAMTSIAVLYEDLENVDKAKEWCRKILEVQPDNTEGLYRIAVIDFKLSFRKTGTTGEGVAQLSEEEQAKTLKLIDEGITVLSKALEKNPDFSNAVDYLNLLYREQAKFTKEEDQKRELNRKADQLSLKALELHRKEESEKAKKGKTKKIA